MKSAVLIGLLSALLGGCEKYPAQSSYEITRGPGVFGYFLKEYRFTLPEVVLSDGSTHEWCFNNLSFNSNSPQLLVVLSADSGVEPSASGVTGSVELKRGNAEFTKLTSGPFADFPGALNTAGQWCSQSYSNAVKPRLKSVAYSDCRNLHIEILSWGSYCMRLNITSVDPTSGGIKAHFLIQSSWK